MNYLDKSLWNAPLLLAIFGLVACAVGPTSELEPAVLAEDPAPEMRAVDVAAGEELFVHFCDSCHTIGPRQACRP